MSKQLFFKGISYSYLRQIIMLVTIIISTPLLINYFGIKLYGIWVLIVGLTGYLNTISFGIPTAMGTFIAKTANLNEKYNIFIKSIYLLSALVFLFLIVFIYFIYYDNNWIIELLGNISEDNIETTKKLFILFVIVTLIKIPLNLYMQFFVGMNMVYIYEIYQIFIYIINFLAVLITIFLEFNIFAFAIIMFVGQFLLGIISIFHVSIKFKYLKYKLESSENVLYQNLFKSGFAFFQVGIAASIVWSTDNLVISHFSSPEYITSYSTSFKIFAYIFFFSTIVNGVIAPIYGNAYSNNDWESIKKYTLMIHKLLPVLGGIVWIFLIFFTKEIIILWIGDEKVFGGYLLMFSLGLYGYLLSFVTTYATLLTSLNFVKHTLSIAWSEAILNLIFSIILINYFGIGGVALGTALSVLSTGFLFLPKKITKLTKNQIVYDFYYIKKHFILLVLPSILVSVFIIDFSLVTKITVFILMSILYVFFSWKFLSLDDRMVLYNLIKRKG